MHRFRSWTLDPPEYRTQRNRLLPIEGGDGSTLNLDFTTGVLDPRLSFSRTSNATFINSSGYVELAAANMIKRSGDLSQNSAGEWTVRSNLITTGWTGFEGPLGSTKAIKLIPNTTNATHYVGSSDVSLAIGLPHTVSLYVKASGYNFVGLVTTNSNARAHFNLSNQTHAGYGVSSSRTITDVGNGWYRITMSFVVANGPLVSLWIYAMNAATDPVVNSFAGASGSSDGVLVWGAQINLGNTVQPYYETEANAYYAPRFDYDPTTLAPRGLLIEGQTFNLLSYSENFAENTPGNWTGQAEINTTGTPAWTGFTAPNQQTTAHKIIPNTNNGQHYLEHAATSISSGTTYTVSLFVKPDGYNFVGLAMTGSQARATYQLVAPYTRTTYVGSEVATITPYQNGWFRIALRWTASTTSSALRIYVQNAQQDPVTIFAGDNTGGIQAWGAQLEAGVGASSYIPTGSGQGTRNADVCYMANTDYGFSTSGGTYLAEWHRGSIMTTAGGGNNAFATDYVSGRWLGIYTGGASSTGTAGSWAGYLNSSGAVAGLNKMAVSYSSWIASASGNTSLNGGAIVSGTLTLGTTPTYLFIGAASQTSPYNGAGYRDPLNNSVRRIKYWPSVLPNAQLQSLTAP